MNWIMLRAIVIQTHRYVAVWFSYLVGLSIVLQETWADMASYIPARLRHVILGTAGALVIADKILVAVRNVKKNNP